MAAIETFHYKPQKFTRGESGEIHPLGTMNICAVSPVVKVISVWK